MRRLIYRNLILVYNLIVAHHSLSKTAYCQFISSVGTLATYKKTWVKFALVFLSLSTLVGCVYPSTYFVPKASSTTDYSQGQILFIDRGGLDLMLSVLSRSDLFSVFLEFYYSDFENYYYDIHREVNIDLDKIKIVDLEAKEYQPTAMYVNGEQVSGMPVYTLKVTEELRVEFPGSISKLNRFQFHTGMVGNATRFEMYIIEKTKGLGVISPL